MSRRYAGAATCSRPGGPCRAVWLRVGRLVHGVRRARLTGTECTTHPGNVPRTYLSSGFHGTIHSATTCRKTPRVATGDAVVVPSIYPTKPPALLPSAELLKEAVSRARLRVRLDRVAAVFLA